MSQRTIKKKENVAVKVSVFPLDPDKVSLSKVLETSWKMALAQIEKDGEAEPVIYIFNIAEKSHLEIMHIAPLFARPEGKQMVRKILQDRANTPGVCILAMSTMAWGTRQDPEHFGEKTENIVVTVQSRTGAKMRVSRVQRPEEGKVVVEQFVEDDAVTGEYIVRFPPLDS